MNLLYNDNTCNRRLTFVVVILILFTLNKSIYFEFLCRNDEAESWLANSSWYLFFALFNFSNKSHTLKWFHPCPPLLNQLHNFTFNCFVVVLIKVCLAQEINLQSALPIILRNPATFPAKHHPTSCFRVIKASLHCLISKQRAEFERRLRCNRAGTRLSFIPQISLLWQPDNKTGKRKKCLKFLFWKAFKLDKSYSPLSFNMRSTQVSLRLSCLANQPTIKSIRYLPKQIFVRGDANGNN